MLVSHGLRKHRFLGIHLKAKAPCFHKTFGSISALPADFNLDSGLTDFNQNIANPVFGTPAQPEGCTGMTQSDVATDSDHIIYSPYFTYEKTCYMMNVPVGQPCDMTDSLNSMIVYGLEASGETTDQQALTHRRGKPYSVQPINGDLFMGMISAMSVSNESISFGSTWYQSFDRPINGIVPAPTGPTSGHNWKICGLKTINGTPYLIAKPWLGAGWGDRGFCYFSREILNKLGGEAFTFSKATAVDTLVTRYTLMETLLSYLQRLLASMGKNFGFV